MHADHRPEDRVELRAEVALAGRVVAKSWPLERFIAINPMSGFESRHFGQASQAAERLHGTRLTLDEAAYRERHARGRITSADLRSALRRRFEDLEARPAHGPVTVGDILLADLLEGPELPAPKASAWTLGAQCDAAHGTTIVTALRTEAGRWLSAYCDREGAAWTMPGREDGLYAAWRRLAARDRRLSKPARKRIADLPERADDALGALLPTGRPDQRRRVLEAHLAAQHGWAGHVRWRAEALGDLDLVELLAMRLGLEIALVETAVGTDALRALLKAEPAARDTDGHPSPSERAAAALDALGVDADEVLLVETSALLRALPAGDRLLVWQDAHEWHFRDQLLAELDGHAPPVERPEAQVVTCIDVRSEPLRRHIEATGPYETFGFAGFFGAAIAHRDLGGGETSDLCPVLLAPRAVVEEVPAAGAQDDARRAVEARTELLGGNEAFHAAKDDLAAPFALADAAGWVAGPLAAARTLVAEPLGRLADRFAKRTASETEVDVAGALTLDERLLVAEALLITTGLSRAQAPVVVLCAHGSHTTNNAFAAALDCGACGGHRGGPTARAAAAVLNDPEVRGVLAERGLPIAEDAWFLAAEHDTTADHVELLDLHLVPASHRERVAVLRADLDRACAATAAERRGRLPGDSRPSERGRDWAQVFPEWGLAGNAAFLVGPRTMSAGRAFDGRTFLHSYDAEIDTEGTALEVILTAPLIVAQWISCQYLCSTVAPGVFGADTKVVHNVLPGIGVLDAPAGDLRVGLPWQSVAVGDELVHEPLRLLAVVEAPLERIETIVQRNRGLQDLLDNEWIHIVARNRAGEPWSTRRSGGTWETWWPATIETEVAA